MKVHIRFTSAVVGLAMLALVSPPTATAECLIVSRWPSFREAASTARRIVTGTVVQGQLYATSRFVLRVDERLRGAAPDAIQFDRFRSRAPTPTCPRESVLRASVGDQLVIAYGAKLKGVDHRIRAVAFVSPSAPDSLMRGAERLTIGQVYQIAGIHLSLLEQVVNALRFTVRTAADAIVLSLAYPSPEGG